MVNPRTQGWIAGFLERVSAGFELDPSSRYTLEARVYVSFYEGTPMGEQLGLETMALSKQLGFMPGTASHCEEGARAGDLYVQLYRAMDGLRATLG